MTTALISSQQNRQSVHTGLSEKIENIDLDMQMEGNLNLLALENMAVMTFSDSLARIEIEVFNGVAAEAIIIRALALTTHRMRL